MFACWIYGAACSITRKARGQKQCIKATGSSQYWGVCFHKDKRAGGVWEGNIWAIGVKKQLGLGMHDSEEQAALAYDAASFLLYGR